MVPSSKAGRPWAVPRRPLVSSFKRDNPDALIVQVAAYRHERMSGSVGKNRAELIMALPRPDIGNGAQVSGVDAKVRAIDSQRGSSRCTVCSSVTRWLRQD